jgi:rsbT co-antagonist protein RsbR
MAETIKSKLPGILKKHESALLSDWTKEQTSSSGRQQTLLKESEIKQQCAEFLRLFMEGLQTSGFREAGSKSWDKARDFLASISRSRGNVGFSPSETALFVLSLKKPLFALLRQELGKDAEALAEEIWTATMLLDQFGLYTTEVHQKTRESVIMRQQQDMLELSTPVVKLWEGIVALPLIGTLDSARTQVVMEALLQNIVQTGSTIAIIDITGVPTVDTLVAQHLLKTVTAARLMGAECIISGIRPQIAQTIVHLGVALGDVITKASLSDALRLALAKTGSSVVNSGQAGTQR